MRGAFTKPGVIKDRRKLLGLTQEGLAEIATCDAKTVRKAEQGKNIDLYVLGRIAIALDIRLEDIIRVDYDLQATEAANQATVYRWQEAFNQRDIDAILSLCHDDVVVRAPGEPEVPFGGVFCGKQEVRRMHEIVFTTAETEPITPDMMTVHAKSDLVYLHGAATLTCKTSGRQAKLSAIHLFRFEQGMIVELTIQCDTLAVSRILTPAPAKGAVPIRPEMTGN